MIKQIADLGLMSVLGSPMLLKMVPKSMVGVVVKKVSAHYLRSGHHLQEAMQYAAEQSFTALDFGLQPRLFGKLFRSRACREFVDEMRLNYLEPFFEAHPQIDRDAFCKEGSVASRAILKQIDHLIDPIIPKDEDVHRFFSEGEVQLIGHRTSQGESLLVERLEEVEAVTPAFLSFLRYDRLLFQTLQYFFRLRLAEDPAIKAMLDEFKQIDEVKAIQEAREQRDSLEKHLRVTRAQLKELSDLVSGDHGDIIQQQRKQLVAEQEQIISQLATVREMFGEEASAFEASFEQHFGEFEDKIGQQMRDARHEFREAHQQILESLEQIDDHLSQQDVVLDEIKSMLVHLVRRGSSPHEYVSAASSMLRTSFGGKSVSDWKGGFQRAAAQAGLSGQEVEEVVASVSNVPTSSAQLLADVEKSPYATFEVLNQAGTEPRTFYVYFSERICVGRHSRNDLVTYWYPLPDPPDPTNPEWRNWQGSGECHPSLNISGMHLELIWRGTYLAVCDQSSKGTMVGGEWLPRGREVSLNEGAVLSLAGVLSLSYSLLRDDSGEPIGWRLRRLNNSPGREEYLFVVSGSSLTIGGASQDAIAFTAPGVRGNHLSMRRDGSVLTLVPGDNPILSNGEPLNEPTTVRSGCRLKVGEQVVWCFPPQ
jgi:hypothetical protein